MNISKYEAYFHDGELIDFEYKGNDLILLLSTAEICPVEFPELQLAKDNCLIGKLYLEDLQSSFLNETLFTGKCSKEYDLGNILDLTILEHSVEACVTWSNFPPKDTSKSDCITYKFIADKIYWETIPNLEDSLK